MRPLHIVCFLVLRCRSSANIHGGACKLKHSLTAGISNRGTPSLCPKTVRRQQIPTPNPGQERAAQPTIADDNGVLKKQTQESSESKDGTEKKKPARKRKIQWGDAIVVGVYAGERDFVFEGHVAPMKSYKSDEMICQTPGCKYKLLITRLEEGKVRLESMHSV
jgi:hypothetical protein